jgi:hypothetical protein
MSYDAQTIVARTPTGEVNDQVRRPVEGVNATVRLEQLLGPTSQLRAEYSRRENTRSNLGVGDFDLVDRAYSVDTVTDALRVRNTRTIGKSVFSELRFEVTQSSNTSISASDAPTIRVLEQFTSGGAGQMGTREGRQFTVAQNFDFSIAKHMLRAGVLVDGAWWDSTQQTNANGTFTFSSMEDYLAGRPRTYSRRVGDPEVAYSQFEAGWYIQDDFRVSKNLSASVGLRQEIQTNMDDKFNLAPRAAFTYALRKGNIRGGYGIFYDWLESNIYEQVVRVDGTRQLDEVIINPSFPDVGLGAGTTLPASRIQLGPQLTQPTIQQASIGYDRPLGQVGNFRTDYMWTRGHDTLRSVNVNAPIGGVRPDPDAGNVTQIESSGRRASDRISVGLMLRAPNVRGLMGNVTYQYANNRNFADSPLALPANSHDPDADWGPSAMDIRHRVFFMFNTPLVHRRAHEHSGAVLLSAAVHDHHRLRRQRRHGVQRSACRRRPQQPARRVAVQRQHAAQPLLQSRGRPRRRRPDDVGRRRPSATAHQQPAGTRRRCRRRWRRPGSDGDDGRQRLALPSRPLPAGVQPAEHGQLQRVHRQPAVDVFRPTHVGRAAAAHRDRRLAQLLALGSQLGYQLPASSFSADS